MWGRLLGRAVALVEWWSVALLVAMVAVVCGAVFCRYVLNSSLVWYDEFASYLLVWLTFFGAVVADFHRKHINFDLLVNKLRPTGRRVADGVGEIAVLGFQFVLFYYGWALTERMGDETAISLPWVKIAWVSAVLPVAGAMLFILSATRLVELLSGRKLVIEGGHESWSGSSSE
jgi:TRAP-type C4-dicarboxylate transport system permease small subunit